MVHQGAWCWTSFLKAHVWQSIKDPLDSSNGRCECRTSHWNPITLTTFGDGLVQMCLRSQGPTTEIRSRATWEDRDTLHKHVTSVCEFVCVCHVNTSTTFSLIADRTYYKKWWQRPPHVSVTPWGRRTRNPTWAREGVGNLSGQQLYQSGYLLPFFLRQLAGQKHNNVPSLHTVAHLRHVEVEFSRVWVYIADIMTALWLWIFRVKTRLFTFPCRHTTERLAEGFRDVFAFCILSEASWKTSSISRLDA